MTEKSEPPPLSTAEKPDLPPPAEAPPLRIPTARAKSNEGESLRRGLGYFAAGVALVSLMGGFVLILQVFFRGPERTVRKFYKAMSKGDIRTINACVDWERLTLQARGVSFGSLPEVKKQKELDERIRRMNVMMSPGGVLHKEVLETEVRIKTVDVGLDVAEVTVYELSRRTGQEKLGLVGLYRERGLWKIYRLNDL